tara:strand:+ start:1187 stop:1570 length:384 start_codon:yes stop_codon:yes gene_type:complete
MLDIVENSDHILTVTVVGVDMIDSEGKQILDENERTGPDSGNKIRLVAKVSKIHQTNSKNVPELIKIPLDPFMHYVFGDVKKRHDGRSYTVIVVLKGSSFEPAYPGIFRFPEYELETLEFLYKSLHK